jgi:hypothetical protein
MHSHYEAAPDKAIAYNDSDSMFNGHGSANNGSDGPIEETKDNGYHCNTTP